MAGRLNPLNPLRKVQNNIEMFESLSLGNNRSASNTAARPAPVVEITPEAAPAPLLTAISSTSTTRNIGTPGTSLTRPANARRANRDSAIYFQSSYLQADTDPQDPPKDKATVKPTTDVLVKDAIAILKSQPEIEDLEAVLVYIRYGIDGKHDFNIKIPSPKATPLIHALVTVTLPDLWPNLSEGKSDKSDIRIKNTLLAALSSVAGIKAITESIQRMSGATAATNAEPTSGAFAGVIVQSPGDSFVNKVYVDFLATMLASYDTVLNFIVKDCKTLYGTYPQVHRFWPDMVSLLAGGKVFSAIAPVLMFGSESAYWISDAKKYTIWLGQNIVRASIEISVTDAGAWRNLCLLLGTALSFGHNGILHLYEQSLTHY